MVILVTIDRAFIGWSSSWSSHESALFLVVSLRERKKEKIENKVTSNDYYIGV